MPVVVHVVVALSAGYTVGSEFRRREHCASWLACAGGNPIVALAGTLAPLFAIFFVIMLTVPLILEGLLESAQKGNVPVGSSFRVGLFRSATWRSARSCCSSSCAISATVLA